MDNGHIKQYSVIVIVALTFAAAGMVYGWSAPVMVYLRSNKSEIYITEEDEGWIVAAIEFGDIFTPIPAGFFADKFGRKPVILYIVPMYIISWSLIILTRSVTWLIVARIISGMAMGVVASVAPIYLCEIAEPVNRGKSTLLAVVFWFTGMMTSYCVGPYVSYNNLSYISVSFSIVVGLGLIFIPESPYSLLYNKKYDMAQKSLQRLRGKDKTSLENELKSIRAAINEASEKKMACMLLITDPCYRAGLLLAFLLAMIGLLGGVTVMYAYATQIFSSVKGIPVNANQCTIILGFIYLILAIFTTGMIDRVGRRPLLIISSAGSAVSHFIIAVYFYLDKQTSVNVSNQGWILLFASASFCIFSGIGIAPISPVYPGEIFPDGLKGIASGIFTLAQCIFSMIALKAFQVINSSIGIYYSFFIFSFVNMAGGTLIYFYLVETNGKTLAEIQQEFKKFSKISKTKIISGETIPFKSESS